MIKKQLCLARDLFQVLQTSILDWSNNKLKNDEKRKKLPYIGLENS